MEFKNYKIKEFIDDLSRDISSPGGGSTAALVGALASSLNSMVYSFTIGKKMFDSLSNEQKKTMIDFQRESKEFSQTALTLMDEDRKYFTKLMEAYKLPKTTEDEILVRKKYIRDNTITSMEIPLKLANESIKLYENIEFAVNYGNENLISDGIVAAILIHSTIESAIVNVEINYNSLLIKDGYENIPHVCEKILMDSSRKKTEICNKFNFLKIKA